MSIKAYVGRMGSGKTYEVVSSVVYPALCRGRRVVSNIAGLKYEAMLDEFERSGNDPEKFGKLEVVSHEQVLEATFWRTDKDQDDGTKAFIRPGDLVALDEIWRFWQGFGVKDADGGKRPERVMNFFRMHRHFTHLETGVSCDVALITQDIMDVSRTVRAVIEETYCMTKLTAIGSTKRYRVDIFQGGKTTGGAVRSLQRKYEAWVFPFYDSHSQKQAGGADAVEENIDQRGNILNGALFKFVIPIGLVLGCYAAYSFWSFFNPKAKPAASTAQSAPASPGAAQVSHAKPGPVIADEWRVVGFYQTGAEVVMVLSNGQRSRTLRGAPGKIAGLSMEAILPNGDAAADWTGGKSGGMLPGTK